VVRRTTRELGANFDLRVMASFGGTISIDSEQLVPTLASGPIGGCIAARQLARQTGVTNLACTDIGGTSFDVALIVNGEPDVRLDPDIAHFKLNLPMVRIDSVGAGTGSYIRLDPISGHLDIGPDSAGSRIGVSNPEDDVDTITITDCDVVLGLINPAYFLGGELQLDPERARFCVDQQIAKPLGLSPEEAASGVLELFEAELTRQLEAAVMGQGFEPADFNLLGYGGGGPLHVAGYAAPLNFADVLVPSWAAAFSAFGCVCADYSYRLDQQLDIELSTDQRRMAQNIELINRTWSALRDRIAAEFAKSGVDFGEITFQPGLRMQYVGQINDIEVPSRAQLLKDAGDVAALIDEFERLYGIVYAAAAKSPELGYYATLAIMTGTVPAERPTLAEEVPADASSSEEAVKGQRRIYSQGSWREAAIYEMDRIRAGAAVDGPAVIEAPSTTFFVPAGNLAALDTHRIFHLSHDREVRP
jgi:acetone carboxylase, beta subunit